MRSLIVALILAGFCRPAFAQPPKAIIAMNIELYATAPRSYGPVLATLSFDSRVPQIIDGTLRLRFLDSGVTLADLRIPDIVISETGYETTLVVPPLPESTSKGLDIDARFLTSDGKEIVLSSSDSTTDELTLLISPNELRGMLIGMLVSEKDSEKSPPRDFLAKKLLFETHAWQPSQTSDDAREMQRNAYGRFSSTVATLGPGEIPEDPLALCAFNMLVILDEGLGSLRPKQMAAITTWVKGGGRLCVIPDGFLTRKHTDFLTELVSESPDPPTMTRDATGNLVCDESLRVMERYGLGRVAVLSPKASIEKDLSVSECRRLAGFLWSVRKAQLEKPVWRVEPRGNQYVYGSWQTKATASKGTFEFVTTRLMPSNVRMVPLSLVGMLLAVYVFMVGPGDYLFLGLLKARRFTWVVFPLVTAAFTVALVAMSNHYMSTTETGGRIEFNDVSTGGRVVRTSTVRLDFAPEAKQVEDEARAALQSGIDIRRAALEQGNMNGAFVQYDSFGNAVYPRIQRTNLAVPTMTGRFPSRYTVNRSLKQWEPQMSRTLSFEDSKAPDLGFDWDNPGAIWTDVGRKELAARVRGKKDSIGLGLLNQKQYTPLISRAIDENEVASTFGKIDSQDLIRSISSETNNFFRYVSAVSPHGGGTFEDLSMHDDSDPDQWLLLVSWFDGNKQIVYRRLYSRSDLQRRDGAE